MKNQPKKNGLEFYDLMVPSYTTKRAGKKIAVYKKEYGWRIYKQGRIIAGSTEGYSRLRGAENNIISINQSLIGYVHPYMMDKIRRAIANYKNSLKK